MDLQVPDLAYLLLGLLIAIGVLSLILYCLHRRKQMKKGGSAGGVINFTALTV
jgi:uncharacterized membrane protein